MCPQIKSEKVFLKVKAIKPGGLSTRAENKTENPCGLNVENRAIPFAIFIPEVAFLYEARHSVDAQ